MKLSDLTNKQRKLFASHIEMAADRLSNDSCTDIDNGTFDGWTELEKKELCQMYNKYNVGDRYNEDDEDNITNPYCIGVWAILNLAALILSPEKDS